MASGTRMITLGKPLMRLALTVILLGLLFLAAACGDQAAIISTYAPKPTSTTAERTTTTTVFLIPTTLAPLPPASSADGAVPWYEALDHVGELCCIDGPVVSTKWAESSKGKPTFINIGKPYPDIGRVTAVIWIGDRDKFSTPPEIAYEGATVRVTGIVETYEGAAQIEVTDPDQIEIVGSPPTVVYESFRGDPYRCLDCGYEWEEDYGRVAEEFVDYYEGDPDNEGEYEAELDAFAQDWYPTCPECGSEYVEGP